MATQQVILLGNDMVVVEPGVTEGLTPDMVTLIDDIFQIETEVRALEAEVKQIKTDAQLDKKKELLKKLMIANVPETLNQHDNTQHVARRGNIEVLVWFTQRDKVDKKWAKENLHANTFKRIFQDGKRTPSIRVQDVNDMVTKD